MSRVDSKARACAPGMRLASGQGAPGIERMVARIQGAAFSPHRHDTYAIGLTVAGVQRFRFRGRTWTCLPGQCHVLHPDELHDGHAGTEAGFSYRMLYLDPALLARLGEGLPFVREPVVDLRRLQAADAGSIWDMRAPLDELGQVDLIEAVGRWLLALSGSRAQAPRGHGRPSPGLLRVRQRLTEDPARRPVMAELERLSDLDRWALARQFRQAFGTSPSRFRIHRQVALAQQLLLAGRTQAAAASEAGFADQAHGARQFRRATGLSPGQWLAGRRAGHGGPPAAGGR